MWCFVQAFAWSRMGKSLSKVSALLFTATAAAAASATRCLNVLCFVYALLLLCTMMFATVCLFVFANEIWAVVFFFPFRLVRFGRSVDCVLSVCCAVALFLSVSHSHWLNPHQLEHHNSHSLDSVQIVALFWYNTHLFLSLCLRCISLLANNWYEKKKKTLSIIFWFKWIVMFWFLVVAAADGANCRWLFYGQPFFLYSRKKKTKFWRENSTIQFSITIVFNKIPVGFGVH